ncbi:uncharacterized protein CLAFUR5_11830 [Fulvia fulva]|uniref:Tat pathway signal sequence n=1 Tax=Passalora fulva TaxID=5499 RepID=A0A9Q8UUB0_PASFU|nr:uncharacterized protein CLAFUR5_11830 [Fulvia fulva]KAK4628421.1 hypothetical protein CLAFUR0_05067 [Fulvia fulva]UJO22703.1 hypothetical protein CLAFUR5_11830 [Fulvia fulva]WPV29255.1 hypothetical protein CLAFUW7_05071 [Fulvia fulva]
MSDSSTQIPDASRRPASRRITTPSSQRLQTITEGPQFNAPPVPPKSILRTGSLSLSFPQLFGSSTRPRNDRGNSASTSRTPPPAYERSGFPLVVEDNFLDRAGPIEGEKVAELRRQRSHQNKTRGSVWRIVLISTVAFLVVLGLAVGLGVGLTVGRRKHQNSNGETGAASENSTRPFPLGEYSMVTALKQVSTNCTSNAATWSCYPYNVFDASNPLQTRAIFNWILTNSSSDYATINTASTPDEGVPANLTISSTDNPLAITFENSSLTYISPSSNSSSARYTFNFVMEKAVIPSTSITGDNGLSQCFFNQTIFTGTLYLSAGRTYPEAGSSNTTGSTGFQQWPYAIEISQTSPGGTDVPACYQYTNRVVGARITNDLTPQSADTQCTCEYQNF